MTDAEAEKIMAALTGALDQVADMEGHFRRESLAVPFAEMKREMCRYYGVGLERVNAEYGRYQALWRCYQWDRAAGRAAFPDEGRIEAQRREPTLPAAEGGPRGGAARDDGNGVLFLFGREAERK